jgi:hypothetical protein
MNAAGNAELATWKIAVRGESNAGAGNVMVSTPFASLRIAEMYVTLAFEQAAVEQGKETEMVVHLAKQYDFPGAAKVELIGLPNKAVTAPQEATKETKDVVFKITTDMTTPAGNHANLFCRVVVTENGDDAIFASGVAGNQGNDLVGNLDLVQVDNFRAEVRGLGLRDVLRPNQLVRHHEVHQPDAGGLRFGTKFLDFFGTDESQIGQDIYQIVIFFCHGLNCSGPRLSGVRLATE